MAARAAGRTVVPKFSIKKTADRSELLSAGTWIDVTNYISKKNIPTFKNDLEINLSQFSASKLSLIGLDISLWDTNFFNYANFLELKVEYILSGLTGEAVVVFAGWVEKKKGSFVVKRQERANTVHFDVWSYPDYADEVHASSMVAQYIDEDIDGAGASGLVLPHIKSLYVTDANITSFVLKKGVHTISYQVDGVNKQAKLDDGDWVTLSTGNNTLINGDADQKVTVYAKSTIPAAGEFSDDIIVDTPADTFPKNWYYTVGVRFLLTTLFGMAGITALSFDALEYDTADGGKKISFLDLVPNDASITLARDAMESDGTYLWCGVGNKLYRRNMTTGEYVLKQTLTAGYRIRRILFNARNGHLWIFYYTGANVTKLRRYIIGTDTLSAEIAITDAHPQSITISDYNSLLSGYVYSVVYLDTTGYVKEVDGSTLAITTIVTTSSSNDFVLFSSSTRQIYYFRGAAMYLISRDIDTGIWADDGLQYTYSIGYTRWAYHASEQRVYFFMSEGSPSHYKIKSHTLVSNTITEVLDLGVAGNDNFVSAMHYSTTETSVAFTTAGQDLYLLASNAGTLVDAGVYHKWHTMADHGSRLYGVDVLGRLYHYANVVALYVETAKFTGMKVRGAIEKACSSFNLVYKISSIKNARVQRRSDSNGNVVTSGQTVALTSDNMRDISDESFYGDAYDIVKVSNGTNEVNYDGSVFDAIAFDKEKVYPLESDWIPNEILEDLAFNLYQFFSVFHKIYMVPSPAALMQYECLDGATIVHTGKMTLNESGVIVSDSIDNAGRPEFKILANA